MKHKFKVPVITYVEVEINHPDVVARTEGEHGIAWREHFYDISGRDDILNHLAYNCVANNLHNTRMLEGWADLPEDAVSMKVVSHESIHEDTVDFQIEELPTEDSSAA